MAESRARKYTPEQIAAEIARPKRKGGRPKKYQTDEERKIANAAARRRVYWRKKIGDIIADGDIALQRSTFATDEERHESKKAHDRAYVARRIEQRRLTAAAAYYRNTIAP